MALLGVLPLRNPLTDRHKIWQGWLRRGRELIPSVAYQSVQGVISTKGWNVNDLCFLCLLYFLFVLYRRWGSNRWTDFDEWYIKLRVSEWVAFLLGLEQWCHNFRGSTFQKPPNIGTNRRFPAKYAIVLKHQYLRRYKRNQVDIWTWSRD